MSTLIGDIKCTTLYPMVQVVTAIDPWAWPACIDPVLDLAKPFKAVCKRLITFGSKLLRGHAIGAPLRPCAVVFPDDRQASIEGNQRLIVACQSSDSACILKILTANFYVPPFGYQIGG
jgi:hypothetical protein